MVSVAELKKAVESLKVALHETKTPITRDASIQRFEFCVELAWKVSKKIMGTATAAPKQIVREMAQNSLIDDVDLWLKAIDERNRSSHTYNEPIADEVYAFALQFLPRVQSLVLTLETMK